MPHDPAVHVAERIARHLSVLAEDIGARPPGSPANRRANDHLVTTLEAVGFAVEMLPFEARWWEPGPAELRLGETWIPVEPAPFGRPCDVAGPVVRASTDAELDALLAATDGPVASGAMLIVDGELVAEPLFPKAFPFLDLPEQLQRIERLERLAPAAVIGVVPEPRALPLFEDADLAFPYLVVDASFGDALRPGRTAGLRVGGALHGGPGVNVSARSPATVSAGSRAGGFADTADRRTVLSAHVDSKVTTPGAFDNAGGVAVLLALAESGGLDDVPVELVFFNGEDHYATPGELAWFAAADLSGVREAVNLDGAGFVGRGSTVTPFACSTETEARLEAFVTTRTDWSIAPPWYESDHAIFAMRGIPSLAITSDGVHDLLVEVAHTDRDTVDVVDPAILAEVASFVRDWLAPA
jgi:aminopeptidase YwaD